MFVNSWYCAWFDDLSCGVVCDDPSEEEVEVLTEENELKPFALICGVILLLTDILARG